MIKNNNNTNNITEEINNNHGWQKVTYTKKQRKNPAKPQQQLPAKVLANGSSISAVDNVFSSIEKKSVERRKVIEAERLPNSAIYDPVPVRSVKKNSYSDYDDSDDEEIVANGVAVEEKKVKPKKVKKPKVTFAEEAAKIDAADLASFLSDVTMSGLFRLILL